MTKEEICKILECCSSPEYRCNECPIDQKKKDDCECGTFGMGEAPTLIKELTAENERLHASCTELTQCCTKLETLHKIECKRVDTIKAATVREMQERLTSFFANDENIEYIEVDAEYINEQIDQIANEMRGETK